MKAEHIQFVIGAVEKDKEQTMIRWNTMHFDNHDYVEGVRKGLKTAYDNVFHVLKGIQKKG